MSRLTRTVAAAAAAMACSGQALACATCFGKSDAPMAQGMNMGIAALLVVVVLMWAAFGVFFVYLARRSSRMNREGAQGLDPVLNQR